MKREGGVKNLLASANCSLLPLWANICSTRATFGRRRPVGRAAGGLLYPLGGAATRSPRGDEAQGSGGAVSYTHLDVYKRQERFRWNVSVPSPVERFRWNVSVPSPVERLSLIHI